MIVGDCSYILGSRIIVEKLEAARVDCNSAPYSVFVVIESETDAVPIGTARLSWSECAQHLHQHDWDQAERWAQKVGEPACQAVVKLLGSDTAK